MKLVYLTFVHNLVPHVVAQYHWLRHDVVRRQTRAITYQLFQNQNYSREYSFGCKHSASYLFPERNPVSRLKKFDLIITVSIKSFSINLGPLASRSWLTIREYLKKNIQCEILAANQQTAFLHRPIKLAFIQAAKQSYYRVLYLSNSHDQSVAGNSISPYVRNSNLFHITLYRFDFTRT
jgi:hypothetical protein